MKSYLNRGFTVLTLEANNLVHAGYIMAPEQKVWTIANRKHYFTSNSDPQSSDLPPVPILTLDNLDNKDCITSYRRLLKDKGGIYSFINTENSNQYIGSAKDFYLRLNEHLK